FRLAVARLENDRGVSQPPRGVLELDEDAPPEPAPADGRRDVHALQLGALGVEARYASACALRAVVVADDQKDTVGLDEHRRLARRTDVGFAAIQPAHLLLLRLRERLHVGVIERLRPRTHR